MCKNFFNEFSDKELLFGKTKVFLKLQTSVRIEEIYKNLVKSFIIEKYLLFKFKNFIFLRCKKKSIKMQKYFKNNGLNT